MKAVILAGGRATRMGVLAKEIPKPMLQIGDKPLLEHQIDVLKRYGITDIILITGHLSEVIEDYFGDGSKFGVNIEYYVEKKPLGTTGGIKEIEDKLTEDFIVIYGDVMFDIDLSRIIDFHNKKSAFATLMVHPNDHPHDSDLIEVDPDGRIIRFHPKPHDPERYYKNLVNAAIYVLNPRINDYIEKGVKSDFGRNIFPAIVGKERFFGYNTAEYLKDMGTPERLKDVEKDYSDGKIRRLNKTNRRKAIFIDRDGVVVEKVHLLHKIEDLVLYPFTAEALKLINKSEYLAVLVTNQPVVARNLCTIEDVEEINKKMETLLGREGARFDAIYYCPHHPDKGYPEENPEYKIRCRCRKPDIGMIERAVLEHNIDLHGSFIVGDSNRDIECGKNAGVKTVGVLTGDSLKDVPERPDMVFDDLLQAMEQIIGKEG